MLWILIGSVSKKHHKSTEVERLHHYPQSANLDCSCRQIVLYLLICKENKA